MTSLESRFFRLLDKHARSEYQCSLTEMWLRDDRDECMLCFRPLATGQSREKRRLCCYMEVAVREAMKSAHAKLLSIEIVDDMKKGLSGLYESAQ
jgi:hypothetical protein